MFMLMLAAMSGGSAAPVGPQPVVSAVTVSGYQSGLCNKGVLQQTSKLKVSWSITHPGSEGYHLGVYVNGVSKAGVSDSTTSWIWDTGTAGLSSQQTSIGFSVKVILTSTGAVLQTVLNGPSNYNTGGCS